jgi:hypothetical protein
MTDPLAELSALLGVEVFAVRRDPEPAPEWDHALGRPAPAVDAVTGKPRRRGWTVTFRHPDRGVTQRHLASSDDVRRPRLLAGWTGTPGLTSQCGRSALRLMHEIEEARDGCHGTAGPTEGTGGVGATAAGVRARTER